MSDDEDKRNVMDERCDKDWYEQRIEEIGSRVRAHAISWAIPINSSH